MTMARFATIPTSSGGEIRLSNSDDLGVADVYVIQNDGVFSPFCDGQALMEPNSDLVDVLDSITDALGAEDWSLDEEDQNEIVTVDAGDSYGVPSDPRGELAHGVDVDGGSGRLLITGSRGDVLAYISDHGLTASNDEEDGMEDEMVKEESEDILDDDHDEHEDHAIDGEWSSTSDGYYTISHDGVTGGVAEVDAGDSKRYIAFTIDEPSDGSRTAANAPFTEDETHDDSEDHSEDLPEGQDGFTLIGVYESPDEAAQAVEDSMDVHPDASIDEAINPFSGMSDDDIISEFSSPAVRHSAVDDDSEEIAIRFHLKDPERDEEHVEEGIDGYILSSQDGEDGEWTVWGDEDDLADFYFEDVRGNTVEPDDFDALIVPIPQNVDASRTAGYDDDDEDSIPDDMSDWTIIYHDDTPHGFYGFVGAKDDVDSDGSSYGTVYCYGVYNSEDDPIVEEGDIYSEDQARKEMIGALQNAEESAERDESYDASITSSKRTSCGSLGSQIDPTNYDGMTADQSLDYMDTDQTPLDQDNGSDANVTSSKRAADADDPDLELRFEIQDEDDEPDVERGAAEYGLSLDRSYGEYVVSGPESRLEGFFYDHVDGRTTDPGDFDDFLSDPVRDDDDDEDWTPDYGSDREIDDLDFGEFDRYGEDMRDASRRRADTQYDSNGNPVQDPFQNQMDDGPVSSTDISQKDDGTYAVSISGDDDLDNTNDPQLETYQGGFDSEQDAQNWLTQHMMDGGDGTSIASRRLSHVVDVQMMQRDDGSYYWHLNVKGDDGTTILEDNYDDEDLAMDAVTQAIESSDATPVKETSDGQISPDESAIEPVDTPDPESELRRDTPPEDEVPKAPKTPGLPPEPRSTASRTTVTSSDDDSSEDPLNDAETYSKTKRPYLFHIDHFDLDDDSMRQHVQQDGVENADWSDPDQVYIEAAPSKAQDVADSLYGESLNPDEMADAASLGEIIRRIRSGEEDRGADLEDQVFDQHHWIPTDVSDYAQQHYDDEE